MGILSWTFLFTCLIAAKIKITARPTPQLATSPTTNGINSFEEDYLDIYGDSYMEYPESEEFDNSQNNIEERSTFKPLILKGLKKPILLAIGGRNNDLNDLIGGSNETYVDKAKKGGALGGLGGSDEGGGSEEDSWVPGPLVDPNVVWDSSEMEAYRNYLIYLKLVRPKWTVDEEKPEEKKLK